MDNKSCCGSEDRDSKAKEFIKINTQINIPGQFGSLVSPLNGKSCCCGDDIRDSITKVSTKLTFKDKLGGWKARWGINRMNYKVNPGIYAVGEPDKSSQVLVTANYKMTFDTLRKELSGLSVWIMVLDTKGINVWCAAGKGTFGTKELISRIGKTGLNDIVSHRTLILPQLGAPGVSAHEVTRNTGFKIVYGPVRATDIKEFISSGMKSTEEMRTVKFSTYDRLVLTPMELVPTFKVSMIIFGILFLLNLVAAKPFGMVDFYGYAGAIITGCVLTPVLLPWIPGKAFAWKGWLLGFLWAIVVNLINGWPQSPTYSLVRALGYMFILPAVSSFYAMNFTGSSTYTSFSGVLKEMKIAIPFIIAMIASGAVMILLNSFIGL